MTSVDISMLGNKELQKKLHKLVVRTQKKIVRQALRKEAKEAKSRVVSNIGMLQLIKRGVLLRAFQGAKIKSTSKKNFVRIGPEFPTREELGIAPGDKYYYPTAVEFGHGDVEAKPYMRPAIDEHKDASIRKIGGDIASGIEREARK